MISNTIFPAFSLCWWEMFILTSVSSLAEVWLKLVVSGLPLLCQFYVELPPELSGVTANIVRRYSWWILSQFPTESRWREPAVKRRLPRRMATQVGREASSSTARREASLTSAQSTRRTTTMTPASGGKYGANTGTWLAQCNRTGRTYWVPPTTSSLKS